MNGPTEGIRDQSILWRRLDRPGHESARIVVTDAHRHLTGTTVFAHDGQPCRLDYLIVCNSEWETLSVRVEGWVGDKTIAIQVTAESQSVWKLNGLDQPQVAGCVDIDLNFSPSTNLLPVRRLGLPIGQQAQVKAAWLRFPSFRLEPLEQLYRRTGPMAYHYESAGGKFVAELQVNEAGFVTEYPNAWRVEQAA